MTRLSQHFTLAEATRSRTARRKGLSNQPDQQALVYMALAANTLLEPLRETWGSAPLRTSSFYRCPELNASVGGSFKSAHIDGRACDIPTHNGLTIEEMFSSLIASGIHYDKAIIEYGQNASWIHVQIAKIGQQPRRRVLSANFDPGTGEMIYSTV